VPEPGLLYLARAEVASLLPPLLEQIDLCEQTYRAMAAGRVELPPKPGIHPRPDSFLHAMPAYLLDGDIAAIKWVSGYPANPGRGLPYISGLIVVNDAETGVPEAVLDGAEITAARTAAASGACIRRWAPAGWRRAAVLGYGEQGRRHEHVLRALNPEVEVAIYDPRPGVSTHADPRSAVAGAEVVVTAGPIVDSPDPPLMTDWLGERWLLLPVDFDFYIGADPVTAADLFAVDDIAQFEHYRAAGHFAGWPGPELSTGAALDRDGARVIACNLGVGSLDAAFAAAVLARARANGAGIGLPR
jgi:ornithine cyclodeaminase/alanine dehydrogenase-like protein (mu-crystallin family)